MPHFVSMSSMTSTISSLSLHDAHPICRSLPTSHASTRAVTSTTPSTWDSCNTSESRYSAASSFPSSTGTWIRATGRSEEHTSVLQSLTHVVCCLLLV